MRYYQLLTDHETLMSFVFQFAGLWYEIEKTESDNSLESGMYNFEYSGDNLMTFSYAGLRSVNILQ